MERIAQKAPKPCYGLEFDLSDPICNECSVQKECFHQLGRRGSTVPIDRVDLKLVPRNFNIDAEKLLDPERPHVERTYVLCYQTIFGKRPKDNVGNHQHHLLKNVALTKCSLRLYMLTVMIGWREQRKEMIEHSMLSSGVFTSKMLVAKNSVERVDMYRKMCRKEFATFDISSISTLVGEEYAESDMERRIQHSELIAAKTFVGLKIRLGGPVWKSFYGLAEFKLDPYWLAIEPSYEEHVLDPYLRGERGTKTESRHRHSVAQVKSQLKKHRQFAIGVFQAREAAIRKVLPQITGQFGYAPTDFEVINEPFTDAMDFWVSLARAIQHMEVVKLYHGDKNLLAR